MDILDTASRRGFLKGILTAGAAVTLPGLSAASRLMAQSISPEWSRQIGLELYTVRDVMQDDFEGILAKVAKIGYKEVEPANGYNGIEPKQFRALLDKYGLTAPSTHTSPVLGSDLDKQFAGFAVMGIKYTSAPTMSRKTPPPTGVALGAYGSHNAFLEATAFGPNQPPETLEAVKRKAAQLNEWGKISGKSGVKILIHNHTGEFEKLTDSDKHPYDVYLEETDPELVAMQIDLGWALIAGQDPLAMFRKHPGRYELWHIKDMVGIKTMNTSLSPNARTSSVGFVPVGTGQIDFKPYFAEAKLAGLKHFCVEQDDAAAWGDSVAAARVSYQGLRKLLA